jgi:uncharacterized protein YcbX
MSTLTKSSAGSVVSLWRYPVKSMLGEELKAAEITERGLFGDRAYVLVDYASGKVASAKHPQKWPRLFDCRAAFVEPPRVGAEIPPVRITLPDGTVISSEQGDCNQAISDVFGREVALETLVPEAPGYEAYWPELEGLAPVGEPILTTPGETVTALPLALASPQGTFFDVAVIHLLTTATLNRLRDLYPAGRFEVRRFRPNIVVEVASDEKKFVENDWVGRTLAIGDEVRLRVTFPTPRCVMTTLAQGDLPRDSGILRTAAQHNRVKVGDFGFHGSAGVYADVLRSGKIRRGDAVRVERELTDLH